MGVRGLQSFVRVHEKKLLEDYKLCNTRLVIDGTNLVFMLWEFYKVEQLCGGDYNVFADKCRLFIYNLKTCGVEMYVVFDGGYEPGGKKLITAIARKAQKIQTVDKLIRTGRGSVVPILAKRTFVAVLVEMNIPHVACEYEADREIAVLANRYECPVLSDDSDFYIFDLQVGFIPFEYAEFDKHYADSGTGQKYVPVKLYKRIALSIKCGVKPQILPMFACILGNDFIDANKLLGFYIRNKINVGGTSQNEFFDRFDQILVSLKRYTDLESCLRNVLLTVHEQERASTEYLIQQCIDTYSKLDRFEGVDIFKFFQLREQACNRLVMEELVDEGTSNVAIRLLPCWFLAARMQCQMSASLQDVALLKSVYHVCQIEDLSKPSSHDCSRKLRQVIYALIIGQTSDQTIKEYDRNNEKEYVCTVVSPCRGLSRFPHLPTYDEISQRDRTEMKYLLFASIEFPANLETKIKSDSLKFLLGLLVWLKRQPETPITNKFCDCVILSVVSLHVQYLTRGTETPLHSHVPKDIQDAVKASTNSQIKYFKRKSKYFFEPPEELLKTMHQNMEKVRHSLAVFQACLHDAFLLNELLDMPVEIPSPSLIFCGKFICRAFRNNLKNQEMFDSGSPICKLCDILKEWLDKSS